MFGDALPHSTCMTPQFRSDGPRLGGAAAGLTVGISISRTAVTEHQAEARGRLRSRRALVTSLTNLVAKVITVATSFATVPLTLHYLGDERFGLWMTISSLTALFAFADLGLGNGLLNGVAEANGRDGAVAVRRLLASATAMLSGIALALLVTLLPAILFFDWSSFFGLSDPRAVQELTPALLVFMVCFLFNIVASVVQRTQLGLQMGFLNGIANAVGSVMGLAAVLLAIHVSAGLPWLVAGLLGGPLLALVASGWWLLARQRRDLIPRLGDIAAPTMARLARLGGLFFGLQIASALAFASDNLVGARFAGAAAVGEFAIATKLFSVVSVVVPIFLGPLWPAYSEAIARGDMVWVRRALVRSSCLAGMFAALGALMVLILFAPLCEWWLQRQLAVSTTLLWGLASWVLISAIGTGISMLLNGAHVVREQAMIAGVFAFVCLTGKVFFIQHYGLEALPWTTSVTYILVVLVPYFLLLPGILRRLSSVR
jgi:O-antigen/teichoic acid export membrane protein